MLSNKCINKQQTLKIQEEYQKIVDFDLGIYIVHLEKMGRNGFIEKLLPG